MKIIKVMKIIFWVIFMPVTLFWSCAAPQPDLGGGIPDEPVVQPRVANVELGKASYYADKFQGRSTASGELYDRNKLTAAHPKLPFGTKCRVTNLSNGKVVEVRINDRGPFSKSRIIDLSYRAAEQLDGIRAGVFDVKVEVLR